MVVTGAGGGIMEACQRGAGRERSFGVNIVLPFEQAPNPVIHGDAKLVAFNYFFVRKLFFIKETHAVALFPGGFGTHDEGFEVLTLLQTGKCQPMPLVLLDQPRGTYWKTWHRYVQEHLLRRRMISPEDLAFYKVTDSVAEAVGEITRFYRVYHSMRYVRDLLVMRLSRPLAPDVRRRPRRRVRRHRHRRHHRALPPLSGRARRTQHPPPAAPRLPLRPPQLRAAADVDRSINALRNAASPECAEARVGSRGMDDDEPVSTVPAPRPTRAATASAPGARRASSRGSARRSGRCRCTGPGR